MSRNASPLSQPVFGLVARSTHLMACSTILVACSVLPLSSDRYPSTAVIEADSGRSATGCLSSSGPVRSDFRAGRGGDRDYVRALEAAGGPRKVKVTGSAAYAAPGATLAAATGRNAAPVLGDGNHVGLPPEDVTPFPWWALGALALLGLYVLLRPASNHS